jgi:hypothetical protein
MQTEFNVRDGQTIADLALQFYGDVSGIVKILQDNTDVFESIDTPLESGMKIKYDPAVNLNTYRVNQNGQIINTNGPLDVLGSGFDTGYESESFY